MVTHAPLARLLVLAPLVMFVLAVALGISAFVRRRGLARLRRIQESQLTSSPARAQPSGGGIMRRSIWGLVIVLIVVAAAIQGWSVQVSSDHAAVLHEFSATTPWDTPLPVMPPPTERTEFVPAKVEPPRKPKNWMKAGRPAPVEPAPLWQTKVELSTFPSVPELKPRNDLLDTIAHRLHGELHLHDLPPTRFGANPTWVRIVELERTTLQEKDPKYGAVEVISYQVELTPEGWRELSRLERTGRAEPRMEWAARGLGMLTVLLGAIAAFIRLDEWTKGYYSGRLFLAATGLVASLGFAILSV
jgi:hypothetical protein